MPLGLWLTLMATVLVGALSAITAIVVVWRSNANSRKNLREQLKRGADQFAEQLVHGSQQFERKLAHEAAQRDRERAMSLRREVYLEVAAALTHTNALIGRASSTEHDQNQIAAEFAADLGTISKVHIVGTDATIEAVMTFVNEVGAAFTDMLRRRMPLAIRSQNIETHVGLMNKANADRDRLLAMMQQYNLQGMKDADKWQALNSQFDIASRQFESQRKMAAQLRLDQLREQLVVADHVMEIAKRTTALLPSAVIAVRAELELALDRERYERLWAKQRERLDEVLVPFRADMQQMMSQLEDDVYPKSAPPPSPPP